MSEFVEINLERLLPTFENLKVSKLFSAAEVDNLVRHFRRYEYALSKRTKELKDFHNYSDYILTLIGEIKARRKNARYFNRHENIERLLKYKGAFLHRLAGERFKTEDVFRKEINYLKEVHLLGPLSEAYTRLLQFYGQKAKYHLEAGCFEFYENKSAQNARTILHNALRKFPDNQHLWATLFSVEIGYAKFIRNRIRRLQTGAPPSKKQKRDGKNLDNRVENQEQKDTSQLQKQDLEKELVVGDKQRHNEEDTATDAMVVNRSFTAIDGEQQSSGIVTRQTDAVLNLRLAELVCEEACKQLPEISRNEFIYKAWRATARAGEIAVRLETQLFEKLAKIFPVVEEYIMAKCQRGEKKLSSYELHDVALKEMCTERMCRMYIEFCERRISHDVFASTKLAELYYVLHELNAANAEDYDRLLQLTQNSENGDEQILLHAIAKTPQKAVLWQKLIKKRIHVFLKENSTNEELSENSSQFVKIKTLVDEALEKISTEESLEVWRQYLELACAVIDSPKKLDKIFARAYATVPLRLSAELRAIRLDHFVAGCAAASGDEIRAKHSQDLRIAYKKMATFRPSTLLLHLKYADAELNLGINLMDKKSIIMAYENAVTEFGATSIDAWLCYLRFALKHFPQNVGAINKRVQVNLNASLLDEFNEKWTLAMQEFSVN